MKISDDIKQKIIQDAKEIYRKISPCGLKKCLEDCILPDQIESNWFEFWFNDSTGSTHLIRRPISDYMEKTPAEKRLKKFAKNIDTKTLKEAAKILMDEFKEGSDIVADCILNELESRLEEKDFIEFCDSLV